MYEIVEEGSLAHFKSKILNTPNQTRSHRYRYSALNCIGHGHKTLIFRIDDDGAIDLVYKNKINEETFKITSFFARLHYSIRLDKTNINYSYFRENPENDENVMTRKNIAVIGISVGDLLKHFYHTNKNEKIIELTKDDVENQKMLKLIKRSLLIETTNAKVTNVLGKYQFKRKNIRLWDNLIQGKFIDQGNNDFVGFCNKILFLSENMFHSILLMNNDKYYRNIFNNLSNKSIITKLLRYFMYNEDPEDGMQTQIFHFEKPALVSDILKYFHEKFNDQKYMDVYAKMMKNLNAGQTEDFEKRYNKPSVFKSIQNVCEEYPIYAFKNIYLQQWKSDDLWDLEFHHDDYMESKKNQKYKYKSANSDKIIPIEKRSYFAARYSGRKLWNDTKCNNSNLIKEGLHDYMYPFYVSD